MSFLNLLPSIKRSCGRMLNFSTARFIARKEARRMFISSIFSLSTKATAQARARLSIIGRMARRLRSVSCLESFSCSMSQSGCKMTAAATTGPAKQPLPASSQPHSKMFSEEKLLVSKMSYFFMLSSKLSNRIRPSVLPSSSSEQRSGCGIIPKTFRVLFVIPAMFSILPLGLTSEEIFPHSSE